MNYGKAGLFLFTVPLRVSAALAAFPAAALASEGGSAWGVWLGVGRFFNLFLVLAVLVWLARKPMAEFFARRSGSIREQLAEAQRARAEAEARLAEMESRLSRLDEELKEISDAAEREAQEEYGKMLSQAQQDAEKIVERSRQEIEAMTRAAQQELRLHAAELSVRIAEEQIRNEISDADHARLLDRFVTKLGGNS